MKGATLKSARSTAALLAAMLAIATATWAATATAQPTRSQAQITVLAGASLTNVFPLIDPSPKYSFSGSDTLAAQIRLGAPADVFASAAPAACHGAVLAHDAADSPESAYLGAAIQTVPDAAAAGAAGRLTSRLSFF